MNLNLSRADKTKLLSLFKKQPAQDLTCGDVVIGRFGQELHWGQIIEPVIKLKPSFRDIMWFKSGQDCRYEKAVCLEQATTEIEGEHYFEHNETKVHDIYKPWNTDVDIEKLPACMSDVIHGLLNQNNSTKRVPLYDLAPEEESDTESEYTPSEDDQEEMEYSPSVKRGREDVEFERHVKRARGESDTDSLSDVSTTSSGAYRSDLKVNDSYKLNINEDLASAGGRQRAHCSIEMPGVRTAALYLDADAAVTTRHLLKFGQYNMEDLYCPNLNAETIDNIKKTLKAENIIGAPHSENMSIADYTNAPHERQFSYAWIDGMCGWAREWDTRDAVMNLFKHKLLAPYSVVGYTVNIRNRTGPRQVRSRQDAASQQEEIRKVAMQNGYTVSSLINVHQPKHGRQNDDHNYTVWFNVYKN